MKYLIGAIILILLVVGGYFGYRYHQTNSALIKDMESRNSQLERKIQVLQRKLREKPELKEQLVSEAPPSIEKTSHEAKSTEALEAQLHELKQKIPAQGLTIKRKKDSFRVEILGELLFETGSNHIKDKGRQMLEGMAEILKNKKDRMVLVEGHTDTIHIEGELVRLYPTNWELSAACAISVVHFLQARGVSPKMLSAVARGPFQPVAANDTPAGREKNRRVVIMLSPSIDSAPTTSEE